MDLSTYNYNIQYRPGRLNESPDALSRVCASSSGPNLKQIHDDLCHPGITRLLHFVKSRNLPFSVEEVRTVVRNCSVCMEFKPRFYKPTVPSHLIKATKPMERLNVDFKGPLPSNNRNIYFLNVIDEYSRFPWVFPCSNIDAATVSSCLVQLFTMCGLPNYIHSDRGSSFMSAELRAFLTSKGVASSRSTAYNPEGNGQIERENYTIWKAVVLALKTRGLPISRWQEVIPEVLHATRSLLCTATNETPHERLFSFPRKSAAGTSLPHWLLTPGPVYLKKHVRERKTDPLVEMVELIHCNPEYAHVRYPDGRETTVSLKHLAPASLDMAETVTPPPTITLADPPPAVSAQPTSPTSVQPPSTSSVKHLPTLISSDPTVLPVNKPSPVDPQKTKSPPIMGCSGGVPSIQRTFSLIL